MLRKTRRRGSGAEPLSRPARFTGSRRCPLAPVKANRAAQNAGRGGPLRPPAPPHGRPLAPAPLTAPPAAPAAATARGRPPGAAGRCSAGGGGGGPGEAGRERFSRVPAGRGRAWAWRRCRPSLAAPSGGWPWRRQAGRRRGRLGEGWVRRSGLSRHKMAPAGCAGASGQPWRRRLGLSAGRSRVPEGA